MLAHSERVATPHFGQTESAPLEQLITLLKTDASELLADQSPFVFNANHFHIHRKIGSGSFGTVFEATWLVTGQLVAVKRVLKTKIWGDVAALKAELDILCKVDHPNCLKMLHWGIGQHAIYFVTELATGGELFDRIEALGKFYEFDAAMTVYTVLNAVKYLHSIDIIHRDLKPENILMRDRHHTDFSDLLICDFGLSKVLTKKEDLTQTRVGTGGYRAPEVLLGKTYGKSCDMWSVGVICFILLTGLAPYNGDSITDELSDILNRQYLPNDRVWTGVSPPGTSELMSSYL
jgi:calcium/calmodulin-dependent protein kinase I